MAEMMQLPAESMHEEDWPSFTCLHVVDAVATDIDELA